MQTMLHHFGAQTPPYAMSGKQMEQALSEGLEMVHHAGAPLVGRQVGGDDRLDFGPKMAPVHDRLRVAGVIFTVSSSIPERWLSFSHR